MKITSGKVRSALKCCVYGPEGIGKSTFASKFPNPVFCDTEGSTKHMDVQRTPKPLSWTQLLEQVRYFIQHPGLLGTFVLDTADWAERLCIEELCAKAQKTGIEDFGYGKGYTYLAEEYGKLLNLLEELVERGVHVVVTAHAKMRKFEQPDEMGAYDRWEMKLSKTTAPLVKEWADIVLFASYKTYVVNVDGQGTEKGKNKAQGGQRVMRTTHHPCWDAKNRFGLPDELPFDYGKVMHLFPTMNLAAQADELQAQDEAAQRPPTPPQTAATAEQAPTPPPPDEPAKPAPEPWIGDVPDAESGMAGVPPALAALLLEHDVAAAEVQHAVTKRGYFPEGMPISDYPPDFVKGVLIGAWPQVHAMVLANREETPF